MSLRIFGLFILVTSVAGSLFGQQPPITVTIQVDCWSNQRFSGCFINSGRTGAATDDWTFYGAAISAPCSYADHLPQGSTVVSATVHAYLMDSYSTDGIVQASVQLNGAPLGGTLGVTNTFFLCNSGAFVRYDFSSGGGSVNYLPGQQNTVTVFSNSAIAVEAVDLEVTYKLPDGVEFNVTDAAPAPERRILISNVQPSYAYPLFQSLGGIDAAVPMSIRTRGSNNQYQSGLMVYLRVADPPDTAAYMNLASNPLAHAGDNDGARATLDGTAISAVPNTTGVYQATSGANGLVDFTLRLQAPFAAGDNYQVEGSFSPTFPATSSWKSGTLTAWKRIFVEKRRMLRNGLFINVRANAGDTSIEIRGNRYGGNRGMDRLSSGDQIVLVHAPQLNRSDALDGWYMETHTILKVTHVKGTDRYIVELGTGKGQNVSREPLLHKYSPDSTDLRIGDAIARISGQSVTPADVFDASNDLVTGSVFPDAFTEYIYLPDVTTPGANVPVPRVTVSNESELQHLADKWSSVVAWNGSAGELQPNHQLLIIGDANDPKQPTGTGVTISLVGNETSSYVFRGTIEDLVSAGRSGNADLWAMKTAAHEIAHQWETDLIWNSPDKDHCPVTTTAFDNPGVYCLLAAFDPNRSETQRSNGIARFHLLPDPNGSWHSEYLEIRRRPDPFIP